MTKLETEYNSRNSFQNWFMRTFRSKALASERAEIVAHGTDEETLMKVWEDAIQDSFAGPFLFAKTLLKYSDGLIDALSKDSYEKWMIRKDIDEIGVAKLRPMMISMISNENAPSRLLHQFARQHWEKDYDLPPVSDDELNSIAKHKNLSYDTMEYLLYYGSINTNVLVLKTHVIPNEELQLKYIKTGIVEYRDIIMDTQTFENESESFKEQIAKIIASSQEERFAAGYYTPQEIMEHNIPHEDVVGLLNDEPFSLYDNSWKNLQFIQGDIDIFDDTDIELSACKLINGNIYIGENVNLNLPVCAYLEESILVGENSFVKLPACISVGKIVANEGAFVELPACTRVEKKFLDTSIRATEGAIVNLPTCISEGEHVEVRDKSNLESTKTETLPKKSFPRL